MMKSITPAEGLRCDAVWLHVRQKDSHSNAVCHVSGFINDRLRVALLSSFCNYAQQASLPRDKWRRDGSLESLNVVYTSTARFSSGTVGTFPRLSLFTEGLGDFAASLLIWSIRAVQRLAMICWTLHPCR